MVKRGPGRPRGSRDLHGRARRFDPRWDYAYSLAIARNVRQVRLERGISIDELAAASGVCRDVLFRLERASSSRGTPANPYYRTIVRVAVSLGLSPSELVP